ncbi:ISKra4 family transposase, partial [bacterium]|nr:ISKra4 family transposase [bacterium]
DHGAATAILEEFQEAQSKSLTKKIREDLGKAISYFENNLKRMNYASYRKGHLPIGSGVTEAACKVIVRERMCGSGMKWKEKGADMVLCISALRQTTKRWDEFWQNISQFGISS